jgi:hypothetical protein
MVLAYVNCALRAGCISVAVWCILVTCVGSGVAHFRQLLARMVSDVCFSHFRWYLQKCPFFTQDMVAFLSESQYIIAKTMKKGYIQIKKLKCIDVIKKLSEDWISIQEPCHSTFTLLFRVNLICRVWGMFSYLYTLITVNFFNCALAHTHECTCIFSYIHIESCSY